MDEETFRIKMIETLTKQVGLEEQMVKSIDTLCACVATKEDITRLEADHKEMKAKLYTIAVALGVILGALGITGLVI